MNTSNKTLLMEIQYADSSESLYLMTGQGFEMLREDKGGRELYGVRHKGREYLFFPFSFKAVEAGVLSLHMPPEYEESCLDRKADGARIVFRSLHGVPFFPEMSEEFQSNTGIIRMDASGLVHVHLDRAGEGETLPEADESTGDVCGCGHHHSHAGGHHAEHMYGGHHCEEGHHDHHGEHHCCGHGRHGAHHHHADEALAAQLREAADNLNKVLGQAFDAGLIIRLGLDSHGERKRDECPQVVISQIARPL